MPLSWIYGTANWMYHKLFDLGIKKSVEFELPVISVGNLSTGGTGKTPHVEYLINLLQENYRVGVLSRGYKRKTKGFFTVGKDSSAREAGDEPLQMKRKFPDVMVTVCEERAFGIPMMLLDDPRLDVIILDDAFQHRRVKAGLSILLSDFSNLFTRDHLLPAGNLREPQEGAKRADVIVITKCPIEISEEVKSKLAREVKQKNDQEVFFNALRYGEMYNLFQPEKTLNVSSINYGLLVTGIASSGNLFTTLKARIHSLDHLKFRDHHRYSLRDVKKMIQFVKSEKTEQKIILTTEKDGVRLLPFQQEFLIEGVEIYCVPVQVSFAAEENAKFDSIIFRFIENKIKEVSDE